MQLTGIAHVFHQTTVPRYLMSNMIGMRSLAGISLVNDDSRGSAGVRIEIPVTAAGLDYGGCGVS